MAVTSMRPQNAGATKVQIFYVQPFWRDRGRLGEGRRREFRTEREAQIAARAMGERYARVEVYRVTGYPAGPLWSRPRLIAVVERNANGAVPALGDNVVLLRPAA